MPFSIRPFRCFPVHCSVTVTLPNEQCIEVPEARGVGREGQRACALCPQSLNHFNHRILNTKTRSSDRGHTSREAHCR
jgi:hypothetical protein